MRSLSIKTEFRRTKSKLIELDCYQMRGAMTDRHWQNSFIFCEHPWSVISKNMRKGCNCPNLTSIKEKNL